MLQRKRVDLEFVTPAFTAGVDQDVAEWREPSIRGQLRWWFRAVAGGMFDGDMIETKGAEARVFGSTDRASSVRIRVCQPSPHVISSGERCHYGITLSESKIAEKWGSPTTATQDRLRVRGPTNPIHYLGYGPILWNKGQKKVVFERGRIEAGVEASLFVFVDDAGFEASDFDLLRKALWSWLNLGGIGARSRRGFGSLRATSVDGLIPVAFDLQTFRQQLADIFATARGRSSTLPEWSHFSQRTTIYVSSDYRSWEKAMEDAGAWLIGFRRRYGSPVDERVPKQIRDYEWFAPNGSESHGKAPHGAPGHVPDRAGFGLPLPFGAHDTLSWNNDREEGRRASPLLLRISKFGEHYYSVWTHMPARLIPDGKLLRCKTPATTWSTTPAQETIIDEFLTDLSSPSKQLIKKV